MRRLFQSICVSLGLAVLVGCAAQPAKNNFPELTFQHVDKIKLDVAEVKILETYQSPIQAPYVDQEMPVRLMTAASNWAKNVVVATGQSGVATLSITEASVKETALETKDGITGLLTNEQSERYTSKLVMDIKVVDTSGSTVSTDGAVTRSITVAEDASLLDREKVWFSLVEKTANDMDRKMRENINRYLQSYLAR